MREREMSKRTTRYYSEEEFKKAIDDQRRSVKDGLKVCVKIRFTGGKTRRGRIVKGYLDSKTFGEPEPIGAPSDIDDFIDEFRWGEITEELPTIDKLFYHGRVYGLNGFGLVYLRDE